MFVASPLWIIRRWLKALSVIYGKSMIWQNKPRFHQACSIRLLVLKFLVTDVDFRQLSPRSAGCGHRMWQPQEERDSFVECLVLVEGRLWLSEVLPRLVKWILLTGDCVTLICCDDIGQAAGRFHWDAVINFFRLSMHLENTKTDVVLCVYVCMLHLLLYNSQNK